MFVWHMAEKELPKKAGFYLVASEIEPGYYAINEGEFFKAGDTAAIEPRDGAHYDTLGDCIRALTTTKTVPEDGFYDTKECLYKIKPACWAELPVLPNGWGNQNNYLETPAARSREVDLNG